MPEKITVLRVGAKRNGYRRAGLQFGETTATIPLSALTSHQVKELRTDRMLATHTTEAVVLLEAEYAELQGNAQVAEQLAALLPEDYPSTSTPLEYVANLVEQLRAQTERANSAQTDLIGARATSDALRAQLDELQAKTVAKPDASKSTHSSARR